MRSRKSPSARWYGAIVPTSAYSVRTVLTIPADTERDRRDAAAGVERSVARTVFVQELRPVTLRSRRLRSRGRRPVVVGVVWRIDVATSTSTSGSQNDGQVVAQLRHGRPVRSASSLGNRMSMKASPSAGIWLKARLVVSTRATFTVVRHTSPPAAGTSPAAGPPSG